MSHDSKRRGARRRSSPFAFAFLLAWLLSPPGGQAADEPWVLRAGPFATASNVTDHNKLGQDAADIKAALSRPKPDFAEALTIYGLGRNFPMRDRPHAFGRFADDYHSQLGKFLRAASELHGDPAYMNAFMLSALIGTGRFASASDAERRAAVEAGLAALTINWARFELKTAEGKAQGEKANWSLDNGAPKNWNEIFAFYWGPGGRHVAFEAVAAREEGAAANDRLLAALAAGQEALLKKAWPSEQATAVSDALDAASLVLFRAALDEAAAAENDFASRRAAASAYWLAASETVAARDKAAALAIADALKAAKTAAALKPAVEALAAFRTAAR